MSSVSRASVETGALVGVDVVVDMAPTVRLRGTRAHPCPPRILSTDEAWNPRRPHATRRQTDGVTVPGGAVTTREQEVLDLLSRHLTNVQIADTLSISVRTVESHVSSLLRKLQLADRRSLARAAAAGAGAGRSPTPPRRDLLRRPGGRAPRARSTAIERHRMVTAIGPGGVGKTRLVLRVAAEVAGNHADGVVFVDLVHVSDPTMVAAAIAEACDVPERHGTSVEAALTASLSRRATCCWSSTTASTCSTGCATASTPSWPPVPTCACWPPAEPGC